MIHVTELSPFSSPTNPDTFGLHIEPLFLAGLPFPLTPFFFRLRFGFADHCARVFTNYIYFLSYLIYCSMLWWTVLNEDSVCIGVARVGAGNQCLMVSTLSEMTETDLGPPLHSLVIVGHLHPLESDMLRQFATVTNNALSKLYTGDRTWLGSTLSLFPCTAVSQCQFVITKN